MPRITSLPFTRKPLAKPAFQHLPLGSVLPLGWLERQLRIQADGVTGILGDHWPDVGDTSNWAGGDGEAWERGPYYLDGLLPLAYLLDDQALIAKANAFIEWTLNSQDSSGWFGPESNNDWWSRMIMLKCLAMHYEVMDDDRILPFMSRYFRFQLKELPKRPLEEWAKSRGGENILVVHWLYELTGERFLLKLASLLFEQTDPWWEVQSGFPGKLIPGYAHQEITMLTHGVNNAMGLKTATLIYRQTGDSYLKDASKRGIANLEAHHGQPTGMFATDEHLNGTSPTSGAELCAVDEYMFTLEDLCRLEGEVAYADRLESLTYNCFASTFTPDMMSHQFDHQVNQVLVSVAKRNWSINFDDANVYGLEPNYGCCTANLHQGWPKFATNLWMATPDHGLAAIAYAPCFVSAPVGLGSTAEIQVQTEYPFDGLVTIRLNLDKPTRFPLVLRVPGWALEASVSLNGKQQKPPTSGTFYRLTREWQTGDVIELQMPMKVRVQGWHEGLLSVYRGPLLFGLKMGESYRQIKAVGPFIDWEISPTTPWNYGLSFDFKDLESSFIVSRNGIPEMPWDGECPPVEIKTTGRRLPQWTLVDNSAGPITGCPQPTECPPEEITLVPFGSTRLRIAAFPIASNKPAQ